MRSWLATLVSVVLLALGASYVAEARRWCHRRGDLRRLVGRRIAEELLELWRQSRSARLFEDIDYGQWGLRILAPRQSLDRTTAERRDRPDDIHAADLVIGEFLGDQELLVLALDEEAPEVLVALPLEPRTDWYRAGSSLTEFLADYLSAVGEKFWE